MAQSIRIKQRGTFPKRSFKQIGEKAWSKFFAIASPTVDLACWEIEADSATLKLTARNSSRDEDDRDWEPPSPIVVLVDGILESLDDAPESSSDVIRKRFKEWAATAGILESFISAAITQKLRTFLPKGATFAVVWTPKDDGLSRSEFTVLWSNRKQFTAASLRKNQTAAKTRARKKPVKKAAAKKTKK